jgi:cephalosporin-C deacetylase
MAFFDLPLDQLTTYKPKRNEPKDFDAFWKKTLSAARAHKLNAQFKKIDVGLRLMDTYDVTFNGAHGDPIKGWLVLPKQRNGKLPCVVEYIGYGGGRRLATDWTVWPAAGFAVFAMDTRGQGWSWGKGDTSDPQPQGTNNHFPGHMTRGILSPDTYYYGRVFTDAVRAVEAAQSFDGIDPDRIAATGGSQGGGITIAAAALSPAIKVAMPDVPFLCHYRRATQITTAHPYEEISRYLMVHRDKVEQAFDTLSYFDGVNLAARAKAQALFSVGLMDETCPPSTVFAAYNHWKGKREIRVYEYNHHEGGGEFQGAEKIKFLTNIW